MIGYPTADQAWFEKYELLPIKREPAAQLLAFVASANPEKLLLAERWP
jgi:hypothetical protein